MIEEITITEDEERRYTELQLRALDCARSGDHDALELMLNAGMPANLQDAKGNTLVMLASYHGNSKVVELLVAHGAEVDRRNLRGQTPLAGVCFKGYEEVVDVLLENGADPNADQGAGQTPLSFAALFGHKDIVERLKEAGGSVRLRDRGMMAVGSIVNRMRN
ncbi:ankyrin repeat domain-containing protein [Rubellicoccus peritrichatus]|uniref:Ankyrin repeat domain-containing protein n=1 Tax=Rubellicoccus peritrichatus TaxID=3080537 RepID=A0AAQ3L9R4_9BACT|nr:ankyrin repeat domain-containing protein [Puniceicoccus sp. CR14]WOO41706.1 ankyrin repeat domain-containing protein [Puniceicoccus sp. CR14]